MDLLRALTAIPGVRPLWRRVPIGNVETRVRYDIWSRPNYAYGLWRAVRLAREHSIPAITAIEFGVAAGDGLAALEDIADRISEASKTRVHVVGFDAASGMPPALDYRDLPFVWRPGSFPMNEPALRARLRAAELIIGNVSTTVGPFLERCPAPIGFVSFDLDYYSSTMEAFKILDGPSSTRLPRIQCYFDDVIQPEGACYSPFTGELLAIDDFNAQHAHQKIAKLQHLGWLRRHPAMWNDQMYVCHDFEHPLYNVNRPPDTPW